MPFQFSPNHPRDPATADVTVVISITAEARQAAGAAARLAEALRTAVDLPAVNLLVSGDTELDLPRQRSPEPGHREPVLRILAGSRTVLHHGSPVELSRLEFDLLLFLCRHPHKVHRRTGLLAQVWGTSSYPGTRTVDVHVRRIRRKLGADSGLIKTVRGIGYLVDDAQRVLVEQEPPSV